MPKIEAIADNIIPREAPKPIPDRVVVTRSGPRPAPKTQNPHQPTTGENSVDADSSAPAESVTLSPQVSALARKEQAFRQRERVLAQREKDLEAKLAKGDQYDQLQTKMVAKDYSEMEKLGLNYEEYAKYKVDQLEGADPLADLKNEIAALKKSQEESAEEQFKETVSAYRKELTSAVESKPEFLKVKKFEDTDPSGNTFTGIDVALQLILDAWESDGEEMTVDQALSDTELFIRERAKKMAALIEEPKQEEPERMLPPPKRGPTTLTNDMLPAGEKPRPQVPLHTLSEAERYAEARRRAIARRQQQG